MIYIMATRNTIHFQDSITKKILVFEVLRELQLQWQVDMMAKGSVKNKNTEKCIKVE